MNRGLPARLLPALLLALGLSAPPVRAVTKLEGDFQMMMDLRKNDRPYLWQFDSNSYDVFDQATFRLFSQPRTGIESYMKFEAAYNPSDNNYPGPQFQYREAHLRFRREFGTRGFDSYVFSRQDRFYVNSFLIPWVYGRGDAQGVRLDTWGFGKTNATFIVADQSGEFNPANFPNVPTVATASLLFPAVQAFQQALITGDPMRYSSLFTQHMMGVSRQWQSYASYGQFDENLLFWDNFYTGGGLVDLRSIQAGSAAAGDKVFQGIAQAYEAMVMETVADLWGDSPYSEAVNPAIARWKA